MHEQQVIFGWPVVMVWPSMVMLVMAAGRGCLARWCRCQESDAIGLTIAPYLASMNWWLTHCQA